MVNLQDALQSILTLPTPDALVMLQGALLTSELRGKEADRALEIAGHFHAFLCELQSKVTARQYSELASRLDIGAVGAVVFENMITAGEEDFWRRLILGGIAEGLMVGASRQYVKGWQAEAGPVYTGSAWYLTEALWRSSCEMQPDLPPDERWQAIRSLLAPAYDADVPGPDKAVLLGRIFQILLIAHLSRLLAKS